MTGSSSPENDEIDPPDGTYQIAREEAREVVSEQLQTLRDTDQKAMSTARINGLILGVLASAASLADNPDTIFNVWVLVGGALLLGSLCVAVLTYTVDRPSYGIGPGYFDTVLNECESQKDVENDILGRYADWIDDNSEEISTNGSYLLAAQMLFIAGLLSIGFGVSTAL